jgi:hypothetical protein
MKLFQLFTLKLRVRDDRNAAIGNFETQNIVFRAKAKSATKFLNGIRTTTEHPSTNITIKKEVSSSVLTAQDVATITHLHLLTNRVLPSAADKITPLPDDWPREQLFTIMTLFRPRENDGPFMREEDIVMSPPAS